MEGLALLAASKYAQYGAMRSMVLRRCFLTCRKLPTLEAEISKAYKYPTTRKANDLTNTNKNDDGKNIISLKIVAQIERIQMFALCVGCWMFS